MRNPSPYSPAPLSYRGIPLVTGGQPSVNKTALTVEAYIKWYDIYGVATNGSVRAIDLKLKHRYEADRPGRVAWSDHIPTPGFCRWLAETLAATHEWDLVALDLIAGRWLTEGRPRPDAWNWVGGRPCVTDPASAGVTPPDPG